MYYSCSAKSGGSQGQAPLPVVTDTLYHLITEHCQEVHKRVGTTREFRFDLGYAATAHEVSVFIRKSPISGGHETQCATEAGTVNSTGNASQSLAPIR